jgi:type II secretory pathway component GspD/PulD (secretin)
MRDSNPQISLIPRIVVFALALFLAAAPSFGDLAPQPTVVSLSADSTSVNEILEILANRSGLNIITSPEVQSRKISIHLEDTPFDEAFNLVVRAAGLGFERVGSSILVADPSRLAAPTGLISQVFDLQYSNAEDMQNILKVLTETVSADVMNNRVIIRGTQSQLEEAGRIISSVDKKPTQIYLETRLIEVNTNRLVELGVDWEKLTKWSTIVTEENPGFSSPDAMPTDIGYTPIEDGGKLFRQFETLEVAIDALLSDGDAKMLANAKIVTLDGVPAEIFAGETVPVIISSLQSSAAAGAFQTVALDKIDVGVRLNITPRATDSGHITTLVEPEISRILRFVGPDEDLPQTSTRRAKSLVRVRDGQKIFLGGLLSEEERSTVKKVPFLGQIPFLGRLFSHTTSEKITLDLLIEVTPRIVGDEGLRVPVSQSLSDVLQESEMGE